MQADAHDMRHGLVERLAEQHGLRLDPADAEAEDTQAVDHRRVRVRADDRVRIRDPAAVGSVAIGHHRGQELEVDLVDDPGPGWHHAQVPERGLGPAEELVALAVPVVLALDVERERPRRTKPVDLDRMIDDQVGRDERVDLRRVATERGHGVAHDGQVDDCRDAGEVLEDHAGGHERDLGLGGDARAPGRQGLDVLGAHDAVSGVTEQVLEQDLDRDRRAGQVEPVAEDLEPVDVRKARAERCSGAEGVDP